MRYEGHPGIHDVDAVAEAFEQAPLIMIVCEGPDHRIMAINAAGRAAVPGREILGRRYVDVTPEIVEQGWLELFDRVYSTGESVVRNGWRTQLVHADGSGATVFWLDFEVGPLHGADGGIRGIALRIRDVSERLLAAEADAARLRELSARFTAAREAVDTLQRALLPTSVPILPSIAVAAHHLLAADEAGAGGDWFDVVHRPGHVVLVVGDVVGHGVEAAATMGQQRAVLLSRLEDGEPIADAIDALDRRARRVPDSFGTTVCIVDLNTATGDLEYVTAGHPPPLVLSDEADRFLPTSGTGPLGAAGAVTVARDRLGPGGVVVLYTDGIVELPGTTPAQGTVQLLEAVRAAYDNRFLPVDAPASGVERIATQVIETLIRKEGYADDITLVAARRTEPPQALRSTFPADATAPAEVGASVRAWLEALDARASDVTEVVHAAFELAQNASDHAYKDRASGDLRLMLDLTVDGDAQLTISDAGSWDPGPAVPGRGLGLALTRSLMDEVTVDRSSAGTTITARRRLGRAAGPLTPAGADRRVARGTFDAWHHRVENRMVIGASGPLDASSVPELAPHLAVATADGSLAPQLDLTDLTLLSSAGVHLILSARSRTPSLEILAPTGSVAQHVLSLVAVPHTTTVDAAGTDQPH